MCINKDFNDFADSGRSETTAAFGFMTKNGQMHRQTHYASLTLTLCHFLAAFTHSVDLIKTLLLLPWTAGKKRRHTFYYIMIKWFWHLMVMDFNTFYGALNLCLNTEIEKDISEILSRKTIVTERQITVQSRPVNSCPVGNSIRTQRLWWKPCHLGLSHANPASWLGAAEGLGQQLITRPWHQHTCQWSVTPQPAKKSTLWSERATTNRYCTTTSAVRAKQKWF